MTYRIHPIVMGTKVFDKGMMTYQHDYGTSYTIPIYCWYLEGGARKILVDTGEMNPVVSEERERAIGGRIHTFESGLAQYGLAPSDIDIILHTHLHNDHCENDFKCENATIYVHERSLRVSTIRIPSISAIWKTTSKRWKTGDRSSRCPRTRKLFPASP